jgi:hypothetical protein
MSGGQQINSGQGAVNVLGDETEGTMVGSVSTASPGSFGKSVFALLRSRKILDSSTSRTLTGSALSGLQGAFGKTRTRALTGSASSGATGTITYVPGVGEPPPEADKLVETVSADTGLAGLPEVLWYSNNSTLDAFAGGQYSGARDFYVDELEWPTQQGHVGGSIQLESALNLYSYRSPSCYHPDHYLNGTSGSPARTIYYTQASASSGNGAPWMNHRKYFSPLPTPIQPAPSRLTYIGTQARTEAHYRYGVYLESSIFAGMTETGVKLGGFESNHLDAFHIMWFRKAIGAQLRWQLQCYWSGGDVNEWTGGSPTDHTAIGSTTVRWERRHGSSNVDLGSWYGGLPQIYLYPEKWYWFEIYLRLNSSASVADGERTVWLNDQLIVHHPNCKVHSHTGTNPIAFNFVRPQFYHGGQSTIPTQPIYGRHAGNTVATSRIGRPLLYEPQLYMNQNEATWVNSDSFFGNWNSALFPTTTNPGGAQRVDMQYSNAHVHTDGRQLEFAMALHSRSPGDNVGVRWAEFNELTPPDMGYYWNNNDTNIAEHDNFATAYLPWKGWVALFGRNGPTQVGALVSGQKIISIDGTPSAIFRNVEAVATGQHITDFVDVVYPTGTGFTAIAVDDKWHNTNYNPACWVNPTGTMTGWWGGGYSSSFPGSGNGSVFKLLDDNPNYGTTSTKPLRLRVFRPTGKPSPMLTRHMVQIGDWLYWGGGMINADSSSTLYANDTAKFANSGSFYRIKVSDLANLVFTQEQITSAPVVVAYPNIPAADLNVRYCLLCADTTRKWLIYGNVNGFYRYKVPADDGNDGTWEGPYTFGMTSNQWASTMSEGAVDIPPPPVSTGNWHGLIGSHRSDLGRNGITFFRYNNSRRWNKIEWNS